MSWRKKQFTLRTLSIAVVVIIAAVFVISIPLRTRSRNLHLAKLVAAAGGTVYHDTTYLDELPEFVREFWLVVAALFGKEAIAEVSIIDLGKASVSSELIEHLSNVSSLRYLSLRRAQCSDDSISRLIHLKTLTTLDMRGMAVTNPERERLRTNLPTTKIMFDEIKGWNGSAGVRPEWHYRFVGKDLGRSSRRCADICWHSVKSGSCAAPHSC